MDKSKETITINITFNAPIELVWDAWSRPEYVIEWWGPKGMQTTIAEHNFDINRQWKYAMLTNNGQVFVAKGKYTEIIPFKKISSLASFEPMTENVEIESLFKEDDDKTYFTFNIIYPTEIERMQQEQMGVLKGWNSTFNRLNSFLLELNA